LVLNKRSDFLKFKKNVNEYTESYLLIYLFTNSYKRVIPPMLHNLFKISYKKLSRRKKFKSYFEKRRWFLRKKLDFKIKLQKQRQALIHKRNKKYNPMRWLSFNVFKQNTKNPCLTV
jgi:hypothetical protein